MYEAAGIYPAQSFFSVNPANGDIRVIRSLREDSLQRSSYTVSTAVIIKQIKPKNGLRLLQ